MRTSLFPVVVFASVIAVGCPAPAEGQYPARPDGCDVKTFPDSPPGLSDNIGPVTATCAADVSDEDCMRTLKDQACKLGGDIVWGVSDRPTDVQGKKQFAGRAAHSKTAAK